MTRFSDFRKVLDGVATRQQMFELFNESPEGLDEDRIAGTLYTGRWFEITEADYESMLDVLPPICLGAGTFAMSEAKAGNVRSVFFAISILGRHRWFHGYCDFSDRDSPNAMRAAIVEHETLDARAKLRAAQLDLIWEITHPDFRGIAGALNPSAWPKEHRGKRTILVWVPGAGTVLKLLEDLTDDEIAARLPPSARQPSDS